ncbi:hypothetical protein BG53_04585 [Paenibacillus darwinianus]|uniref:Uncharacterized protein n=1 Tax=Paenibacillus darwinianus TaxID=1380763 RepID=A0A9W5S050_9BACL|nr:hypothetical protein [Paenibacillus darwinianus]EXX86950.1 hypothetical protein CH50_06240 [Paenibacillus darwinianus]EXX87181.1 hypothetical protein BG52_04795 [Paenibacillus darwinianus]EXX87228.1 hypothetical protein BG53_04585 [Paenibacillus darwinianus]
MKLTIIDAGLTFSKEDGYVGYVHFEAEGHKEPYEMTLQKKNGKEWSYGLFFLNASGGEEQLFEVEELLEESDEAFDELITAAKRTLDKS